MGSVFDLFFDLFLTSFWGLFGVYFRSKRGSVWGSDLSTSVGGTWSYVRLYRCIRTRTWIMRSKYYQILGPFWAQNGWSKGPPFYVQILGPFWAQKRLGWPSGPMTELLARGVPVYTTTHSVLATWGVYLYSVQPAIQAGQNGTPPGALLVVIPCLEQ
jgi:hypothetical protein